MRAIERTGIAAFFGTDDNFFNARETVEDTFTELARGKIHGKPFAKSAFFGTEATEFDVYKNKDLLALCRSATWHRAAQSTHWFSLNCPNSSPSCIGCISNLAGVLASTDENQRLCHG